MDALFLLAVAGATSLGTYVFGRRVWRLPGDGLPAAAGRLLECVGLTVAFAALNVLAGAAGVLLARALTGRFWSMYVNTDSTILLLALAQAVVVQWWKAGGRKP
jgi:hypothetical protein